jgi:hypothetical protein
MRYRLHAPPLHAPPLHAPPLHVPLAALPARVLRFLHTLATKPAIRAQLRAAVVRSEDHHEGLTLLNATYECRDSATRGDSQLRAEAAILELQRWASKPRRVTSPTTTRARPNWSRATNGIGMGRDGAARGDAQGSSNDVGARCQGRNAGDRAAERRTVTGATRSMRLRSSSSGEPQAPCEPQRSPTVATAARASTRLNDVLH